jgi:negative regulator of flagellin synthesis FlgM
MTMDIERVSQQQPVWPVRGAYPVSKVDRAASGSPRAADSLEISAEARELARIHQAVEAAPDVRAEKVASIKKRIQDGTYTVSPELLARKMIEDASHDL